MSQNNNKSYAAMITVNPRVHFGQPCVAGTRITVANVLELIEAGVSMPDIINEYYPDLTEDQIKACVRYVISKSERQLTDLKNVLATQKDKLDLNYLRGWAARFNLNDELEALL